MPALVYSSSGEDNGADRCWRKTDKRTGREKGHGWVSVEVDEELKEKEETP